MKDESGRRANLLGSIKTHLFWISHSITNTHASDWGWTPCGLDSTTTYLIINLVLGCEAKKKIVLGCYYFKL